MNKHLDDDTIAELSAGDLEGEALRVAEAHVAECADCANASARVHVFRQALSRFEPAPNPDFVSDVMSRLNAAGGALHGAEAAESSWLRRVREWLAPSAAVVAGALLLISSRSIQMQYQVLYPDEAYIMGVDNPVDDLDAVFGDQDI